MIEASLNQIQIKIEPYYEDSQDTRLVEWKEDGMINFCGKDISIKDQPIYSSNSHCQITCTVVKIQRVYITPSVANTMSSGNRLRFEPDLQREVPMQREAEILLHHMIHKLGLKFLKSVVLEVK